MREHDRRVVDQPLAVDRIVGGDLVERPAQMRVLEAFPAGQLLALAVDIGAVSDTDRPCDETVLDVTDSIRV